MHKVFSRGLLLQVGKRKFLILLELCFYDSFALGIWHYGSGWHFGLAYFGGCIVTGEVTASCKQEGVDDVGKGLQ